jgi:hypothetical protein
MVGSTVRCVVTTDPLDDRAELSKTGSRDVSGGEFRMYRCPLPYLSGSQSTDCLAERSRTGVSS